MHDGDMKVMMWWMEAYTWMDLHVHVAIDDLLIVVNCDANVMYQHYSCACELRCNGLELCSRQNSCFHVFWGFPRPILAIYHIAVFLSEFPV